MRNHRQISEQAGRAALISQFAPQCETLLKESLRRRIVALLDRQAPEIVERTRDSPSVIERSRKHEAFLEQRPRGEKVAQIRFSVRLTR